ncbi:MAG TPA: hypothetical protein VN258_08040 [Mobilitalea sp.]|nr:hypothetical protein [Mobilitalea sp.]
MSGKILINPNNVNLTMEQIQEGLKREVVQKQLALLKFRNIFPAFGFDAELQIPEEQENILKLCWENNGFCATLEADLKNYSFEITATNNKGEAINL